MVGQLPDIVFFSLPSYLVCFISISFYFRSLKERLGDESVSRWEPPMSLTDLVFFSLPSYLVCRAEPSYVTTRSLFGSTTSILSPMEKSSFFSGKVSHSFYLSIWLIARTSSCSIRDPRPLFPDFDYQQRPQPSFFGSNILVKSESNLIYLSKIWVKTRPKKRIRDISRFATKVRIWFGLVWSRLRAMIQSKSFNMVESACLQCESWSFYFRNSPGLLDSPFFIQIDTFGKWLRCLTMSVM